MDLYATEKARYRHTRSHRAGASTLRFPAPVRPSSHTARQAVLQLRSEIAHARSLGYSFAQIAEQLNDLGIPLASSTLRNYTSTLKPPRKRGKPQVQPGVRNAPAPAKPKTAAAPSNSSQAPSSVPVAADKPKRATTFVLKPDRIKS